VAQIPSSVQAGGGFATAAGLAWIAAASAAARQVSGDELPHIWGLFAGYGALITVLSLVTFARSPRAWLLLQMSSAFGAIVGLLALLSVFDSPGSNTGIAAGGWSHLTHDERFLVSFGSLSALAQLASMLLLNRRTARRWCRVDPEGIRLSV
jgi:hypothetical protein